MRRRATALGLSLAGLVAACSPQIRHAPSYERTGVDEEIFVAEAEESAGEPLGVRGRALLTVLELRDRATPEVQQDTDAWLRHQISTFEQMSTLTMTDTRQRMVDHLPAASPYRQAEHAYARWITATHPETLDDFATSLFALDDSALSDLDRRPLALERLTTFAAGTAGLAAIRYLEGSPDRGANLRAYLTDPAQHARLRHLFRHALGSVDPLREETAKSTSHCRSVEAAPTAEQTQTFLALWSDVAGDEASWNEGVRALADVRVGHGSQQAFAPELNRMWLARPERHGAVLYAIASILSDDLFPSPALFVRDFYANPTRPDFDAMLAFDPRAVLVVARLFDVAPVLPRTDSFVAAMRDFRALPDATRLRNARDPSLRASVASFAGHLCKQLPPPARRAESLAHLKKALENDSPGTDGVEDMFKCAKLRSIDTTAATRIYGSDC